MIIERIEKLSNIDKNIYFKVDKLSLFIYKDKLITKNYIATEERKWKLLEAEEKPEYNNSPYIQVKSYLEFYAFVIGKNYIQKKNLSIYIKHILEKEFGLYLNEKHKYISKTKRNIEISYVLYVVDYKFISSEKLRFSVIFVRDIKIKYMF